MTFVKELFELIGALIALPFLLLFGLAILFVLVIWPAFLIYGIITMP